MDGSALHDPFPRVAARARVASNAEIAPGVFELVIERAIVADGARGAGRDSGERLPAPVAGQFFMLRARPSAVLLGRPISAYRADESSITFLILKKGEGSAELCALRRLDSLDLVGPIGNRFLPPEELASAARSRGEEALPENPRIAVIGGGIGVAPVAGFSLSLAEKSFDFYASFRSSPYGLESVAHRASRLVVTTEDGSAGVKGMLPAVFESAAYDLVYACGPTPMLRYVQSACSEDSRNAKDAIDAIGSGSSPLRSKRPLCFVSLEEHMACGAGACLGCTVRTTGGNRRCCVDGPVFNAAEVIL